MKELLSTFNEGVQRRLRNPILAGFLLSWIPFNWRLILYLSFSNKTIEQKFPIADSNYVNWWNGFAGPLITACAIHVTLPYLMAVLEVLTKRAKVWRNSMITDAEIDSVRKSQELEDVKSKFTDRDSMTKEIEQLRKSSATDSEMLDYSREKLLNHKAKMEQIRISSRYIVNNRFPDEKYHSLLTLPNLHDIDPENKFGDLVPFLIMSTPVQSQIDDFESYYRSNYEVIHKWMELGLLKQDNREDVFLSLSDKGLSFLEFKLHTSIDSLRDQMIADR